MARSPFLIPLIVCGLSGACEHSSSEAERAEQPAPAPRSDSPEHIASEIDRLRALPYAGYAPGGPDDREDGVVTFDARRSSPGYNLYVMHERSAAELIDAEGRVLRGWRYEPSQSWSNGELLPDGDFLVVGVDPSDLPDQAVADEARYILRFNWEGELLWKRGLTAHHDVAPTPRGNLLTLTFERRIVPEISPEIPVRDDRLTLLSGQGEVLKSVSLYDVLRARPEVFPIGRIAPDTRGGSPWIDLFHCNSIEWMHHKHLEDRHGIYAPGNVLICFRHQNRVAIVNWDEREALWAWGARELSGPHDAHVLENGNLLIFDNGVARGWSRVIELDPLRLKTVWEYRAPRPKDFFTISKGANQRLPNGNTLITNSDSGQVFEVTPAGEIVWEFWCPYKNDAGQRATIVRAKRYECAYVDRLIMQSSQPASQPAP